MWSLTETQILDPRNTVLQFYWLSYPAAYELPTLIGEQFNTVQYSDIIIFSNNLGFEHTTSLGLLKSFST
jgi:hypothetical protein